MKICRYGDDRLGVVEGSNVRDITALQSQIRQRAPYTHKGDPLVAFVHAPENRRQLAEAAAAGAAVALSTVRLLAPVVRPTKVIAAPTNYQKHIEEMAPRRAELGLGYTARIGEDGLFLKANSAIVGPSEGVAIRFPDRRNDHEAEVVIVIGKEGSDIPMTNALDYVAGYCLGLDMTVRGREDRSFRKSPDGYAVLGPWLATADEIPNPEKLAFELRLNGQVRQKSSTSELVYGVKRLIEFASSFYTLFPGDLIYTGTPEGVGPVKPGDVITLSSEPPLGTLEISVRARTPGA
jgi:2-keto-4-pentenoate hydratase/2-oxohepta-3-ene-1,7-dioic acid hydratase in catechol pathway